VLKVNRRKPGPVDLRVLRRFTWTESDPFAQYEKLLSAYSVADWSEEHFNNRALFSDYYLKERLKGLPEWNEDPKPTYRQLRDLYLGAGGFCVPPPSKLVVCPASLREMWERELKTRLGYFRVTFSIPPWGTSSVRETLSWKSLVCE